ncbi:uncharacterized protein M421DRAFT_426800 [Didymella exigua CBS 183.55]|uniref:Uncharacterized protein n=1 Tax=Didymella exigua CBS 183.55 TaxID=1150837 RepID=A0A6A5R4F3_9PLEO|nr:uncharacterized protein M421DRAFT_426800 [Didymella exigua CBS 183.55]KAF1922562.1 hypothetical protein M421DRAFT_426800 [Didymella exigua CBS 183.55]
MVVAFHAFAVWQNRATSAGDHNVTPHHSAVGKATGERQQRPYHGVHSGPTAKPPAISVISDHRSNWRWRECNSSHSLGVIIAIVFVSFDIVALPACHLDRLDE